MRGIARYVEMFGPWSLFIDPLADSHYPRGRSESWRGDGILTYIEAPARAERLADSGIPTVELFAYRLDGRLPLVAHDDPAVGRLAAEHLLERQFRQFAFCGYRATLWSQRRRDGFVACLREHECAAPAEFTVARPATLPEWEEVQQRLTDWVRRLPRPIGLMTCSDHLAQLVLDACQRAGVVVPEEIAVIGVDADEEICRLSNPPLTSVMLDAERVGYEGAQLLDRLMAGRRAPAQPHFIPPLGIATRRSTDITAIADPLVASAARVIREQACSGLTVDQLVQRAGLSRSIFYQRFHDALGRSPHHEILRMQLERVRSLLTQTDLPLKKIADLAGFNSASYLHVAFKRELGLTLGDYRRRQNGNGGHHPTPK